MALLKYPQGLSDADWDTIRRNAGVNNKGPATPFILSKGMVETANDTHERYRAIFVDRSVNENPYRPN